MTSSILIKGQIIRIAFSLIIISAETHPRPAPTADKPRLM